MPWTDPARRRHARPAARYATDLTEAGCALVAPRLPASNRLGRPREVDLREVVDAILCLLRTGCPRRPLPKESPPKSTVLGCFRRLGEDGTRPTLHALLVMAAREQAGREAPPTAGVIDSQSVRTTESGAPEGYVRCRQGGERPPAPRPGRRARPAAGRREPRRQHPRSRRAGLGPPPRASALPLAWPGPRRRRPPGRDRGPRGRAGGAAAGNRHPRPRRTRLRRPAPPMGGGTNLRLARPQPAARQGFRGHARSPPPPRRPTSPLPSFSHGDSQELEVG
jgi:transposase